MYKVYNKSESISAGCWDKDGPMEYAVFGPNPMFAFGEVVALFVKREHADHFMTSMNFILSMQKAITIQQVIENIAEE